MSETVGANMPKYLLALGRMRSQPYSEGGGPSAAYGQLVLMNESETSSDDPAGREPIDPEEDPRPTIEIVDPHKRLGSDAARMLGRLADQAAAQLDARGEVRIKIIDDREMSRAHEQYKDVPGTTDVLTFDLRDSADDPLDTDLLICIDEAARQADQHGHTVEKELLLYIVHGLLHCLGYDDQDPASAALMHQREDEILVAIGAGAVYAPGEANRKDIR